MKRVKRAKNELSVQFFVSLTRRRHKNRADCSCKFGLKESQRENDGGETVGEGGRYHQVAHLISVCYPSNTCCAVCAHAVVLGIGFVLKTWPQKHYFGFLILTDHDSANTVIT